MLKRLGVVKRSSSYKGVTFNRKSNKWMAYLTVNGKQISAGTHDTEVEAAHAIDLKLTSEYPHLVPARGLNFRESSF